ncbi:ion transporter [Pseudoalteromonas denitrificans]|uniref:Voltage-gated sodium channel n=1 Tax=Pseudoalteromonas denitrificans DSM 6059 TaxID=1123010 RepID=A0A1I1U4E7_9GAMM|nr:ion transporter [Pseudoalteromonas denitrificans]SFD62750.1 voltage-gated sodium channel [Pseudoalteromonas denitrificans DSM 6059]
MNFSKIQSFSIRLKTNKIFELFVIGIIVFSALLIGAKTYEIPTSAMSVLKLLDWFITFIFLFEIVIRFIAEENKKLFFTKGWNIFDTLIVIVSLIPIEDSELALVGRLIRIFRVMRMVSFVPELRLLLNSLLRALPQLGYVVLLMFIIFYIYAAIGSSFFAGINSELWGDISISMLTLFRVMTFEDWTDVMYEIMDVHSLSWIYFLSFIFLTTFAFLNMVIGIVVNVLEDEHSKEKEAQDKEEGKLTIEDLSAQINELKKLISNK